MVENRHFVLPTINGGPSSFLNQPLFIYLPDSGLDRVTLVSPTDNTTGQQGHNNCTTTTTRSSIMELTNTPKGEYDSSTHTTTFCIGMCH